MCTFKEGMTRNYPGRFCRAARPGCMAGKAIRDRSRRPGSVEITQQPTHGKRGPRHDDADSRPQQRTVVCSVYTVACSLDAPHSAEIRRLWSRDTGRRAASVPWSFRCCRSRTPAGRPPRWRRNGRCQFIRCENTIGEQASSNAAARAAWGRPGAAMGKAGRVDVPTTTDR